METLNISLISLSFSSKKILKRKIWLFRFLLVRIKTFPSIYFILLQFITINFVSEINKWLQVSFSRWSINTNIPIVKVIKGKDFNLNLLTSKVDSLNSKQFKQYTNKNNVPREVVIKYLKKKKDCN